MPEVFSIGYCQNINCCHAIKRGSIDVGGAEITLQEIPKKLMSAAHVTLVAGVQRRQPAGCPYLSVQCVVIFHALPGHPGYKNRVQKNWARKVSHNICWFARAPHHVMTKTQKKCRKGWRWGEVGCMFFNPSLQCTSSSASPIVFFTSISKSFNLPKIYF